MYHRAAYVALFLTLRLRSLAENDLVLSLDKKETQLLEIKELRLVIRQMSCM